MHLITRVWVNVILIEGSVGCEGLRKNFRREGGDARTRGNRPLVSLRNASELEERVGQPEKRADEGHPPGMSLTNALMRLRGARMRMVDSWRRRIQCPTLTAGHLTES